MIITWKKGATTIPPYQLAIWFRSSQVVTKHLTSCEGPVYLMHPIASNTFAKPSIILSRSDLKMNLREHDLYKLSELDIPFVLGENGVSFIFILPVCHASFSSPVGLEYVTEIQVIGQSPRYHCELCDSKFDHNLKFPHLVGAKHRLNVLVSMRNAGKVQSAPWP